MDNQILIDITKYMQRINRFPQEVICKHYILSCVLSLIEKHNLINISHIEKLATSIVNGKDDETESTIQIILNELSASKE